MFGLAGFLLLNLLTVNGHACSRAVDGPAQVELTGEKVFQISTDVFEGKLESSEQIAGSFEWKSIFTKQETFKGQAGEKINTLTRHDTCDPYPFTKSNGNEIIFYSKEAKKFFRPELAGFTKKELRKWAAPKMRAIPIPKPAPAH